MLTFKSSEPEKCGVVELNEENIVVQFYEKVKNPPSNIANGAVFAFESEFIEKVNNIKPKPKDFSKDVIPYFLGKIQTCYDSSKFLDIGTPKNLKLANKFFK